MICLASIKLPVSCGGTFSGHPSRRCRRNHPYGSCGVAGAASCGRQNRRWHPSLRSHWRHLNHRKRRSHQSHRWRQSRRSHRHHRRHRRQSHDPRWRPRAQPRQDQSTPESLPRPWPDHAGRAFALEVPAPPGNCGHPYHSSSHRSWKPTEKRISRISHRTSHRRRNRRPSRRCHRSRRCLA
jgi:hypothetical protein